MKKIFKKFLIIIAIFMATTVTTNLTPTSVHAGNGIVEDCRPLFGMNSWDCKTIKEPDSEEELKINIWIIVSNISTDITIIAAYLVLGFVIYGGYLYMLSNGDTNKVLSGKRTLTNAFIGLGIVLLANVIINSIRIALLNNATSKMNCFENACVDSNELISNLLGWVFGITGLVAVIFIVIGGIGYVTSAGDPAKVQKSRKTLTYALIGLAIVGLSSLITAFVTNIINNSQKPTEKALIINEKTIAKEVTYEK